MDLRPDTLATHPLWIDKAQRATFTVKQTALRMHG
jgi:hypothetical protein